MLIHQPPSDERIIECLNMSYGIKVHRLFLLPLGADKNACVYKAVALDTSSFFVKLNRGGTHDISIAILNLLSNANIPLIIPPLKTMNGEACKHINDYVLMVYPFIEGQNGFAQPLTDNQWVLLGQAIKLVHEVEVPATIQQHIRHEDYSSKWRESVQSLLDQINNIRAEDKVGEKLVEFMKKNQESIQRLVARADSLSEQLKNSSSGFVLCHADIHAGNVLIGHNGDIFIVDWDHHPMMAPKERDLMFIGGGVGNVWNDKSEEKHFYEGYGDVEIDMPLLAYYRHERIVDDIAVYAEQLLLTTEGGEDRAIMYKHFVDMFEPRGVVDIAFETGEKLDD